MVDRILIAGAGPAGLSLAAYLTKANIPVCIFEAEASLPKNLRASTFHPPTLDFLEPFGASKVLIDEGLIACLLYTSPSPRDGLLSRMPSSA